MRRTELCLFSAADQQKGDTAEQSEWEEPVSMVTKSIIIEQKFWRQNKTTKHFKVKHLQTEVFLFIRYRYIDHRRAEALTSEYRLGSD